MKMFSCVGARTVKGLKLTLRQVCAVCWAGPNNDETAITVPAAAAFPSAI